MREYRIGNVNIGGPLLLAPLAGISNRSTRELCRKMGADMTYTEMVSAKGLHYGDKTTPKLLDILEGDGPTAIQIFGSEPDIMAEAAEKLEAYPNLTLDINMGCPVPKIVKNGDGSVLMKDPELVYRIVTAVVQNTDKPVSVKIRKGFDEAHVNAVEVALAAESGGASMVCVHGRTREQYYSGKADWTIIKSVKEALSIPVAGNGDIYSAEDAERIFAETGCDMIMIARGALGNPWIFREIKALLKGDAIPERPSISEISRVMTEHFEGLIRDKSEYNAVREMRKHFAWYTKGIKGSAAMRKHINEICDLDEMREVLRLENAER